MKAKHLTLAIAALLAAAGLWLARSAWRTHAFHKSSMDVGFKTISENADTSSEKSGENAGRREPKFASRRQPKPGQMRDTPARLAPPDPNRRFTDFTPEQRVQFARQGQGPGG